MRRQLWYGSTLSGASVTIERRINESEQCAPAATIRPAEIDAAIQVLTDMKQYLADPFVKPAKAAAAAPPAVESKPDPAPAATVEEPPFTPDEPKTKPVTSEPKPQPPKRQ